MRKNTTRAYILPIVVDIPTQVRRVITRREKGGGLLPDLRYYEGRFESRRKRVLKSKSKISFRYVRQKKIHNTA